MTFTNYKKVANRNERNFLIKLRPKATNEL